MITPKMLEDWRQAKNLAIVSLTTEPEVTIAVQEMYIESKLLRRENLRLLNKQDLFDKLLAYVGGSARDHYLTDEMEDLLDEITDLCDENNIQLEI